VRPRRIVVWALLAAVAAYLLLMGTGPLGLVESGTRLYIGSIAALLIGFSAATFVALFLITRTRRRG
jgi:hypothetical protein